MADDLLSVGDQPRAGHHRAPSSDASNECGPRRAALTDIRGVRALAGPEGPAAFHAVHLIPADAIDAPLFDAATAVSGAMARSRSTACHPAYIARVVRTPWPEGDLSLGIGSAAAKYPVGHDDGPQYGSAFAPRAAATPTCLSRLAIAACNVTVVMRAGPRARPLNPRLRAAPQPQCPPSGVLEPTNGQQMAAILPGRLEDGQFATSSLGLADTCPRHQPSSRMTFAGAIIRTKTSPRPRSICRPISRTSS